jgi:hypothetical protein
MRSLAISLAALLLIPAGASAKSGLELLGANPDGIAAGQPWKARIVAIRRDHRVRTKEAEPVIDIQGPGGEMYRFALRRRPDDMYTTRVVFPTSGSWTYRLSGFGPLSMHQRSEPVRVVASAAGALDPTSDPAGDASSDELDIPFGWIAAASPIIIAVGLLITRRRRRGSLRPAGRDGRCSR